MHTYILTCIPIYTQRAYSLHGPRPGLSPSAQLAAQEEPMVWVLAGPTLSMWARPGPGLM